MDVAQVERILARAAAMVALVDAVLADAECGTYKIAALTTAADELALFCLRDLPPTIALADVELFRLHRELEKRQDALLRVLNAQRRGDGTDG